MKNRIIVVLLFFGLFCSGILAAEAEKTITIVDYTGMDKAMLEDIQAFAERELYTPVKAQQRNLDQQQTLDAYKSLVVTEKNESDACLIAIVKPTQAGKIHADYDTNTQVTVINATVLQTEDKKTYANRIKRHVMRGVGFLFGLTPAPDPFCVTKHYWTLEELDKMGLNYNPPWQDRFKKEATRRGLRVIPHKLPSEIQKRIEQKKKANQQK